MASITWTSVFGLLLLELVITAILVVPVPRKIRNFVARKCIFRFHLGDNFSKVLWFVAFALVFALAESYKSVALLMDKLQTLEDQDMLAGAAGHGHGHGHHHDKQRLYKAERNMYLAGFALTLLFVIGRLLQLMQESVELEDQLEFATRQNLHSQVGVQGGVEGVEMTDVPKTKQPADKKKD